MAGPGAGSASRSRASTGGAGAGFVDECIFLEEAFRGQAPITAYSNGLTAAQTYLRYGTAKQKKEVLGALCAGDVVSRSRCPSRVPARISAACG